jgi:hypothetical protein
MYYAPYIQNIELFTNENSVNSDNYIITGDFTMSNSQSTTQEHYITSPADDGMFKEYTNVVSILLSTLNIKKYVNHLFSESLDLNSYRESINDIHIDLYFILYTLTQLISYILLITKDYTEMDNKVNNFNKIINQTFMMNLMKQYDESYKNYRRSIDNHLQENNNKIKDHSVIITICKNSSVAQLFENKIHNELHTKLLENSNKFIYNLYTIFRNSELYDIYKIYQNNVPLHIKNSEVLDYILEKILPGILIIIADSLNPEPYRPSSNTSSPKPPLYPPKGTTSIRTLQPTRHPPKGTTIRTLLPSQTPSPPS